MQPLLVVVAPPSLQHLAGAGAGAETVGVMIFAFQYQGNSGEAAALSPLSTLASVLLALLLDRLGRRVSDLIPWRG